jgi:hypothetical protein
MFVFFDFRKSGVIKSCSQEVIYFLESADSGVRVKHLCGRYIFTINLHRNTFEYHLLIYFAVLQEVSPSNLCAGFPPPL